MKYDIVQRCFIMLEGQHIYEVRPRKDRRGADLISDALPFGRLWYGEPNAVNNAIDYAKFRSRSRHAVILGHNSQSDRKVRSSRILVKNGARGRFPRLDAAARR